MNLREIDCEMNGSSSGSCPVVGFDVTGVRPLGSTASELFTVLLWKLHGSVFDHETWILRHSKLIVIRQNRSCD
jgi:hypothetical protein